MKHKKNGRGTPGKRPLPKPESQSSSWLKKITAFLSTVLVDFVAHLLVYESLRESNLMQHGQGELSNLVDLLANLV